MNFSEEDFVEIHLKKELSSNSIVKCKFNNCSYQSDSVIGAIEHMNSCELKPEQVCGVLHSELSHLYITACDFSIIHVKDVFQ